MPKYHYDRVCIFAVKCSLNDDVFVASTTGDLDRAFIRLKNKAKQGQNQQVFHHMRTHGLNNYYVEVLEKIDNCKNKLDIIASEAKYIKLLKPSLNQPSGCPSQIEPVNAHSGMNPQDGVSPRELIDASSSSSEPVNAPDAHANKDVNPDADHDVQPGDIMDAVPDAMEDAPACYYSSNPKIERCTRSGRFRIKMNGKKSKPKNRLVCCACYQYLLDNNLASTTPME